MEPADAHKSAPTAPPAPAAAHTGLASSSKLPAMSAADIAARNVQARGGLAAWRAIQSVRYSGTLKAAMVRPNEALRRADPKLADQLEMGVKKEDLEPHPVVLPIRVERKRPLLQRVEVDQKGTTSVQIYDGKQGWKEQPYLAQKGFRPFSEAERKLMAEQPPDFEPALLDYAAKGIQLTSAGSGELIDGRPTYKLQARLKSGVVETIWVDAGSFLELQTSTPRWISGKQRDVVTTLRDYRSQGGIQWPYEQETRIAGARDSEVLRIESLSLNPPLDDSRFEKPN